MTSREKSDESVTDCQDGARRRGDDQRSKGCPEMRARSRPSRLRPVSMLLASVAIGGALAIGSAPSAAAPPQWRPGAPDQRGVAEHPAHSVPVRLLTGEV